MTTTPFHPTLKTMTGNLKTMMAKTQSERNTSRASRKTSTTTRFPKIRFPIDRCTTSGVNRNAATIVSTALTTDAGSSLNSTKDWTRSAGRGSFHEEPLVFVARSNRRLTNSIGLRRTAKGTRASGPFLSLERRCTQVRNQQFLKDL